MRGTVAVLFLIIIQSSLQAQVLTSSNLPIVVINTNGQSIPDEPKVTARMTIYDNEDGSRNDPNRDTPSYEGFIGIELRGQTSQLFFPKKGYGIETRNADGTDLDTTILGMPKENDWVIHSPYSDKSLIRNALAYIFAGDIMAYAPRVRLCELVLNGSYQGVILWTEKVKRDKNRVDISRLNEDENEGDDLTGGYIIKFDKGSDEEIGWISSFNPIPGSDKETRFLYHYPKYDEITQQQRNYIRGYVDGFEQVLMSDNYADPVNGYAKYIDVASFVETIIINELTRNVDGYRLSTYMYKDKDSEGGKLAMGPTWDHNLSWGNANYCLGWSTTGWAYDFNSVCPEDYWVNHFWWSRLLSDEAFRQQLKDKWIELRRGTYSTENILNRIDSLTNLLSESSARNFVKWPVLGQPVWPNQFVGQTYQSEIQYLRNWVQDRVEWLDDNFDRLTTDVVRVEEREWIKVYPNPSGGDIFFDGLEGGERLELFGMDGRLIYSREVGSGETRLALDLPFSDMILYRILRSDGLMQTGKINVIP